jgi:transcription elongation factor Elf1
MQREIAPSKLTEDFHGNNAAVTCPVCGKVFVVSALLDDQGRRCPNARCGKSTAFVKGGAKSGGRHTLNGLTEARI